MFRTIFQCYLFAGPQPGEDDYGGAEPEEAAGDPEEDRLLEAHRRVGHVRVPERVRLRGRLLRKDKRVQSDHETGKPSVPELGPTGLTWIWAFDGFCSQHF